VRESVVDGSRDWRIVSALEGVRGGEYWDWRVGELV